MTYSEILIQRITALCKRRGITCNKLATMCGLNQSTIDNIIRGITKDPRITTLHHIAIGFNMTLAEFLTNFPSMTIPRMQTILIYNASFCPTCMRKPPAGNRAQDILYIRKKSRRLPSAAQF